MRWQTVVVTAVYLAAYALILLAGIYRARRMYLQGRADEIEASVVLQTQGIKAWGEIIEAQTTRALGRRESEKIMARLPIPTIPDDPGQN